MLRTTCKVLLIDDDEDDFFELRDILSDIARTKYDLVWKSSFEDGLTALLSGSFDSCILDYRLGAQTGLNLLAEARSKGSHCPVIILTGHGDFDLDLTAMAVGAADYLVKGQISAPLLERSIRYSIKNARDMMEIADERENFQILFNSTFEGIIVHSQGKILDANRAVCDIFRCSPNDLIGKDLDSFFRPDFREQISEPLSSGRDLKMEAVGVTLDGHDIYVGIFSRMVNTKGKWVSLLAIRDLTERKRMEMQILQQDRLASLGLLASSLAHEIGTPLGVIRGRAELVQKHADEKTKNTMALIISQIDRIGKLVNSLLHIARGRNSDSASEVSLNSVLDDVLELMKHEMERSSIELEVSVPKGISVQAEAGPLGQVFLNLLVNAIHAILLATNNVRKIEISATEVDRTVRVSIKDTGTGIADEDFSKLFQPFFTTKDIGEGTGLGLATSYKLVMSWGGSIEVESKLGKGSKFTVILQK